MALTKRWLWTNRTLCFLSRKIMYQIFIAVEHMHSHKVIHRDLKVSFTSILLYLIQDQDLLINSQRTYCWTTK